MGDNGMTSEDLSAENYWYPVATSEEVTDQPLPVQLLGRQIVVVRLGGALAALSDLCIHRGTPLSMGRVEDGSLVCGYHGWRFDAEGHCVHIPQRPAEKAIPGKARVDSYKVTEKYGLVWASLGEPRFPIPEYPEYDDPAYRTFFAGAFTWKAGAARMMENFLDSSHFPFVHPGLLGDPRRPQVVISPIERFEDGFGFTSDHQLPVQVIGSEDSGEEEVEWGTDRLKSRLRLPYYLHLYRERERDGRKESYIVIIVIQPISSRESKRYSWISRNYAFDVPDETFLSFVAKVREQDKIIVEAQRPEELPLDLGLEMHIREADLPAVTFRRLLAEVGLEESSIPIEQHSFL